MHPCWYQTSIRQQQVNRVAVAHSVPLGEAAGKIPVDHLIAPKVTCATEHYFLE